MSQTTPRQDPVKQEAILKHSLRRFLKHGVRRTTIADIAKDAGVPNSAITIFYPDKEALVIACFDRAIVTHKKEAKKILGSNLDARGKLRIYLLNRFYSWREMHNSTPHSLELVSILLRAAPGRINEEEDLLQDTLEKIISNGNNTRAFKVDKPKQEATVAGIVLQSCLPLAGLRRPRQTDEKQLLALLDWLLIKWRSKTAAPAAKPQR